MKIVYMGTPKFSSDILQKLFANKNVDVACVFTKPDTVRGRGNKKSASEVKKFAQKNGIDVFCPRTLKDNSVTEKIKSVNPDFICVAAYGLILSEDILKLPKFECLNVHGSLLPRWRGAAPIQSAILAGDEKIGISIMKMTSQMDAGDFCLQYSFDYHDMTMDDIYSKMANLGAKGLIEAMNNIILNTVSWQSQDSSKVTYADKILKKELYLSPSDSAVEAKRKILASDKAHPCKCRISNKNVTIIKSSDIYDIEYPRLFKKTNTDIGVCDEFNEDFDDKATKGSSKYVNNKKIDCNSRVLLIKNMLFLGFRDGYLKIDKIKPDGKSDMDASSFACGIQNIKSGSVKWSIINN